MLLLKKKGKNVKNVKDVKNENVNVNVKLLDYYEDYEVHKW
jgi:hypothetical protein